MSLGKRIKYLRLQRGITQKSLAEKADTPQRNISVYENDMVIPSALMLKKIALALDTDTNYLLEMPSKKTENPALKIIRDIDTLPEKERSALLTIIENFLEVNRMKNKRKK